MFDYFKKVAISNRAGDELLYEFVLDEVENGVISKGLWGKALANSSGDNANAKSIYMQYRVQSIKDIFTAQKITYNELTKPKLFQYIQEKIFPMTNDYISLTSEVNISEPANYSVSKEEEDLYEEVARELSQNIRKEGLWLKALEKANGNENKTLSLYIKYRSESLKADKEAKKLEAIALQQQQQVEAEKIERKRTEEARKKRKQEIEDSSALVTRKYLSLFIIFNVLLLYWIIK